MKKVPFSVKLDPADLQSLVEEAGHRKLVPDLVRQIIKEGLEQRKKARREQHEGNSRA